MAENAELATRCCITCGEIEGTPWVTTRCQFEIHEPSRIPPASTKEADRG